MFRVVLIFILNVVNSLIWYTFLAIRIYQLNIIDTFSRYTCVFVYLYPCRYPIRCFMLLLFKFNTFSREYLIGCTARSVFKCVFLGYAGWRDIDLMIIPLVLLYICIWIYIVKVRINLLCTGHGNYLVILNSLENLLNFNHGKEVGSLQIIKRLTKYVKFGSFSVPANKKVIRCKCPPLWLHDTVFTMNH